MTHTKWNNGPASTFFQTSELCKNEAKSDICLHIL